MWAEASRKRREARLGARQHPFIHFRQNPEKPQVDDESDNENVDKPILIAKTWDMENKVGKAIMSDGSELMADIMEAGPNGFVQCRWLEPEASRARKCVLGAHVAGPI